jgi:acyl carrier protein
MQESGLFKRVFASIQSQEANGAASDWRNRIEAAAPAEKEAVIAQAVREVVGAVLRVKPDTLRDDQPLTDLGLDSLMGVEIENSLEAAIGVALPPTSLMSARNFDRGPSRRCRIDKNLDRANRFNKTRYGCDGSGSRCAFKRRDRPAPG